MEKLAWQTAYIMNSAGGLKKPVTADALLGRKGTARRAPTFAADQLRELEELKKEFAKK